MGHRDKYAGQGGPLPVMAAWALGGLLFWLAGGPLAKAAVLVDEALAELSDD